MRFGRVALLALAQGCALLAQGCAAPEQYGGPIPVDVDGVAARQRALCAAGMSGHGLNCAAASPAPR
jgi:hypothetical protein